MALMKSWWQSVIFRWWDFSPYSRWDVQRHADRDGELSPPVPGTEDTVGPWYVGAMKEHFDNIVRGILARFQVEDQAHRSLISQLQSDEKAAADALARLEEAYKAAGAYFKLHNPDIPVESVRQRVAGYLLITGFLFILEFPMNFSAFKLFGDNANLLTGATAAAIGGALLVLAHYLGIAWHKGPIKNRDAMVDVVVIVTLAVLAIVSVAELRTAYLVHNPETAIKDSGTLMRSFAIFNLMLFGCAAFISRHRHMTGIDMVDASSKALKAARHLQQRLSKELGIARKKREVLRVTCETEAHRVTDQHLELHKLYHMYNTRVRKDRKEGCGPLNPPYMKEVNTSTLVSLPKHFAERIGEPGPGGHPATATSAAAEQWEPQNELGGAPSREEHVPATADRPNEQMIAAGGRAQ